MPKPRRSPSRRSSGPRAPAYPPFADRSRYLRALSAAVQEHLDDGDSTEPDYFEMEGPHAVPHHLRTRRSARSGPSCRPGPQWPGHSHPGAPERRGPSAAAILRGQAAATRKANRSFVWPHEELADAAGVSRALAAAMVVLRVAEVDMLGPCHPDEAKEAIVVAEMAGRFLGVRKKDRQQIVEALQADGELVRGGLVPFRGDDDEGCYGPGPVFLLPRAIRRFIDGLQGPLESTRLVQPGVEQALDWMSERSAEAIRGWMSGRARARSLLQGSSIPTAVLSGSFGPLELTLPEGIPGQGIAGALATLLDRAVLDALPRPTGAELGRSELVAEARLRGTILLVGAPEPMPTGPMGLPFPMSGLDDDDEPWPPELVVVRLGHGAAPDGGIRLEPPGRAVRGEVWRSTLDLIDEPAPDGEQFSRLVDLPLHPEQIVESAARHAMACGRSGHAGPALLQTVGRGVRAGAASAEVPSVRLLNVVMSDDLRAEAEQVVAACRDWRGLSRRLVGTVHDGYGRAPVVLAAGPPGTGKTRFAEALAGELGRALRRLSGPDLRSCWVGEGEKKIRTEFRRDDEAILLLDEVDAFLAARGSGPQAHHDDNLANVLLEEIERTEHVVVMATNRPDGLDAALDRRVLFRLDFESPGKGEREAIWRLHLPPAIDGAEGVDCGQVATHALSGGGIKNASWRAILRASRDGVDLTTELVDEEARREARRGRKRRGAAGFGGPRG